MSVLSDREILKQMSKDLEPPLITPFKRSSLKSIKIGDFDLPCPSHGLSCCGYDVVLQPKFKIANHNVVETLDLLEPDDSDWFIEVEDDSITIPPHGFVLGVTEEYFNIPVNIMASLFCKSTLARRGVCLPPTIAEPGWSGELVVEIINSNPFPVKIHAGIGIGQMIFWKLTSPAMAGYGEKGKYQGQHGIVNAIL